MTNLFVESTRLITHSRKITQLQLSEKLTHLSHSLRGLNKSMPADMSNLIIDWSFTQSLPIQFFSSRHFFFFSQQIFDNRLIDFFCLFSLLWKVSFFCGTDFWTAINFDYNRFVLNFNNLILLSVILHCESIQFHWFFFYYLTRIKFGLMMYMVWL